MKNSHHSQLLLSIICPCFNEEAVIEHFLETTKTCLKNNNIDLEFVFINDGSTDATLEHLKQLQSKYSDLRIINFSRNFGKEAAISAGIEYAKGDFLVFMDADLQDPPELIPKMLSKAVNGVDVVLAKRVDRTSDTKIKRVSAGLFYKLHNLISDVRIPENVGDFRLISRRVADEVKKLPENQRFMKGLFAWVGFETEVIEYTRPPRTSGVTKFSFWRLWNFALDGFTSFSSIPLRIWVYLGMFVSSFSFIFGVWIILKTLILGVDLPGYASIMTTVLFLGGVQLISIGVLGEYIGRIYMETKKRPTYIVKDEY